MNSYQATNPAVSYGGWKQSGYGRNLGGPTVEEFTAWAQAEGVAVIGVDIFPDSVPLETYALPERCVLVFGQEGPGLSEEVHAAAQATQSIAQFGSTRSINAGVAAGIAMHAWVRQHEFGQRTQ